MQVFQVILAISTLLLLAACGGGGGGAGGGGFGSAAQVLQYAPNFADNVGDTSLASISDDGISGVMSQVNTSATSATTGLRSVKVRISADGNTAFLTVDGVTQSMPVTIKQPGGGQFGSVPSNILQVVGTNSSHTLLTHSGSSGASGFGAFGYVGIETPTSQLPAGDLTYSGSWGGQAYNPGNFFSDSGVISGNMTLVLNFGSGGVSGNIDGSVNAADTGTFVGTITGSTSGNGAHGTMTVNGGSFTGAMPFAGNTYGFDAADFAGGFAGSVTSTTSGKDYSTTGTFSLD